MKKLAFIFLMLIAQQSWSQVVTTNPVFPVADQPVTITVDVSGTTLDHYAWNAATSPVWIWSWIEEGCPSNCDAPTNKDPATAAENAARMTRISTNPDKYQITITPTTFFGKPASQLKKIGLKLKTRAWGDNKQSDNNRFITFTEGFNVTFTTPSAFPVFKNQGEQIAIEAHSSVAADLELTINGTPVASNNDATGLNYTHTITEGSGISEVVFSANNGAETKEAKFQYIVRAATVNQTRPAGIIDGINYGADPTKVTLSLWAPGKTSVYAVGDFSDWKIDSDYQMKKDGERFWIEIDGLVSGQEYAFQYLVDETLKMADPYADKLLNPDDQYIPASVYPNLKSFPTAALNAQWYYNTVAVFQTNQTPYNWVVNNFAKPAKEKMVIYELLIRDFFGSDKRSYQSLIDTIGYFKRLGVNTIQLMPIMEFAGNDSWGYNPTFMFAPDKYYGPKNKFKEFVDVCHQNGIAVILDIAMNHHDLPNPYVMMEFDFNAMKPKAANKWFNVDATHPFNVFFDMNHESAYTKKYLDTVNYHWLKEYKIDGYRFDLSKGFTQVNNPNNVDAWSNYDASRIAILKRMADKIWSHTADAIVILEHLSVNSEEKELAEYRANEGKGMMLWGNMNHNYNQNTKGDGANSSISGVLASDRNWTVPHLVGYMESHDEERLMYRNATEGKSLGNYNVKNLNTSLERVKAASVMFYTLPGPKMLWQFGEYGYDISIDENGRTGVKPVKWEYLDQAPRKALFDLVAELLKLRQDHEVFSKGVATINGGTSLQKQATIKNVPYNAAPTTTAQMNVQLVANFELSQKSIAVTFPHTGTWYDYFNDGKALNVTSTSQSVSLPAGGYKLFTDVKIGDGPVTGIEEGFRQLVEMYPNPAKQTVTIKSDNMIVKSVSVKTIQGASKNLVRVSGDLWDVQQLANGLYIVEIKTNKGVVRGKMVKE